MLPETNDLRSIFLNDLPLLDVRAPVEFHKGSFPTACNLPLLDDSERQKVGTCYKREGSEAAISLGNKLVCGTVKEERLARWKAFTAAHPNGYLYCFRGGLRSQTVQRWLAESGFEYPRVAGGFKAMRRFLLDGLESDIDAADFQLISGMTGSGKTIVIQSAPRTLDLEALANHRGSTFGRQVSPQPSQIDFENQLAIALMKLLQGTEKRVYVEDESRLIGRCFLPPTLQARMKQAPIVLVEESLERRIDVVVADYIHDLGRQFSEAFGEEEGPIKHRDKLKADLFKIRKRLGFERHASCENLLESAFQRQWKTNDATGHREWILQLLSDYYDPMYQYQLGKRGGEVVFKGTRPEVIGFLNTQHSSKSTP